MLDYGARLYDPLTARWNGVDALAEQYSSVSPYNYVGGNPISRVDLDGRRTLYVGESGTILSKKGNNNGLVNDPLPDAITIIPREQESTFSAHFSSQYCGNPTNAHNAAQYRAYGVSYDVGSIKAFLTRNQNAPDNSGIPDEKSGKYPGVYYYKDATGRYEKVGKGESGNFIFQTNITPYKLAVIGGINTDRDGSTFTTQFINSIGGNIKGYIHRHITSKTTQYYTLANDGRKDYYERVENEIGYGPSSGDKSKHDSIEGFYNIVWEKPNNTLYFYDKNKPMIEIPLSIFK